MGIVLWVGLGGRCPVLTCTRCVLQALSAQKKKFTKEKKQRDEELEELKQEHEVRTETPAH